MEGLSVKRKSIILVRLILKDLKRSFSTEAIYYKDLSGRERYIKNNRIWFLIKGLYNSKGVVVERCRTAAAVLGAQARRRLTAPGLPGAQGP